jgi:hypothetical protein
MSDRFFLLEGLSDRPMLKLVNANRYNFLQALPHVPFTAV